MFHIGKHTYLEMKELHFYQHFLEKEVEELTMFKYPASQLKLKL